jgi:CRP-like cAMP-binding protein
MLLNIIVSKLTPKLCKPEELIIENFEETRDLYIIAKGECSVFTIDEHNRRDIIPKILRIGSYFGEIAMIYGCRRTCSVYSKKYSTLA